jgi:hypothetical protein
MFPVYGGKFLSHKEVHKVGREILKDVRKSQMMPNQMQKWLRQQSEDFSVEGFETLVKRCHKCINVGGGYIEK